MKRLIIPFPWWLLVAIVTCLCSAMTDCRYENQSVWQGNCSPKEVSVAIDGRAGLWLSCPGFRYSPPFSNSWYMVSRKVKGNLPLEFWCSVTRSGDSSCVLPKKLE